MLPSERGSTSSSPDTSGLHLVQLAPPRVLCGRHEPPRPIVYHRQALVLAPAISPLFRGCLAVDPVPRPQSAPTRTSLSSTPTRYSSPPSQSAPMASSLGRRRCVSPPDLHHREGLMSVSFLTNLPPKLIPLYAALLLCIFPHRLPPLARWSCQHHRRPMPMPCPAMFPYCAASLAPFGPAECGP
jgi:hypothetical protein